MGALRFRRLDFFTVAVGNGVNRNCSTRFSIIGNTCRGYSHGQRCNFFGTNHGCRVTLELVSICAVNTERFSSFTDVTQVQLGGHRDEVRVVRVLQRIHDRSGGIGKSGVVTGTPVWSTCTFTGVSELRHLPGLGSTVDNLVEATALLEPFSQGEEFVGRAH